MKIRAALVAMLLLNLPGSRAGEPSSKIAANPAFDKLKILAGSWEGQVNNSGRQGRTTVRFKLVSDGSALASWLNEGTPHEMVTMIHPDGADLIATHYCSAHNQPRMVLVPGGDPNRLVFQFRDGTNIAPGDGHMQQVTFVLDGADHHIEEWTYLENGKEGAPAIFDFHRNP